VHVCLATQHVNPAFTPLALLYLKASCIERLGIEPNDISLLEFDKHATVDAIADRILASNPDVLGLSCYVWNIRTLMAACTLVKARRPQIRIVIGGPEVGPIAERVMLANPAVDIVVRGEGEVPFPALIDCWRHDDDIGNVNGITLRRGRAIVETSDAPIVDDLNQLPSPHGLILDDVSRRYVCVETQRGCVFRCNFCFYNKDFSIRNRRFALDRVKEEIAFWLQRDVGGIYLMDPVFNLYGERAKDICRFIAAHNHRRVGIHAEVWAEFIDEEMAQLMRDANFTFVEVGLQTTDDTVLATVERRLRMQRFLAGVGWLKQYRIPWELQLIYGLPGETRETFHRSLNFANALDAPQLAVFPLMVLPGTELWRKAADLRLEFDDQPPYFVRSHFSMSAADIAYGWRIVRTLSDIGDSRAIRLLGRERGLSYAQVLDAWMAWCDERPDVETPGYRIKQFILDFCRTRGIPSAFYQGFASWEFAG
jgi:radical SAM superfamily enzyme YgiQ (UPF0313 family)